MLQTPSAVLLVRPAAFGPNTQTLESNPFQQNSGEHGNSQTQALKEFDDMVQAMRDRGITALVLEDTPDPQKPDAIFPNNWISFHHNGTVVIYPMLAPNRRLERRVSAALAAVKQEGFSVTETIDLTPYEESNRFLEGTGSIVFDYDSRIAYMNTSQRSHPDLLADVCDKLGFAPCIFQATDDQGRDIYHTNVVMNIGSDFAIICSASIRDPSQRGMVLETLRSSGKEVIEISCHQMGSFAGNMLEVSSDKGPVLVMSETAFRSLTEAQLKFLQQRVEVLSVPLNTIESVGGGSARCMLAGIHLPRFS
eukprot:c11763_g1_i1.p1 GENE.c11763_g1_i1~~c11763_g1_i1.p1  ORF type:complete len:308 (+),score=61.12 c11763_g1_i1:42-965(+)